MSPVSISPGIFYIAYMENKKKEITGSDLKDSAITAAKSIAKSIGKSVAKMAVRAFAFWITWLIYGDVASKYDALPEYPFWDCFMIMYVLLMIYGQFTAKFKDNDKGDGAK